jgi:hypothetical protein
MHKPASRDAEPVRAAAEYVFKGHLPTPETVRRAYDEGDLNRAVQAYRFFYPTVSGAAIFEGTVAAGVRPNRTFGALDTRPRHLIFTANSDTPYGAILLDLRAGPMVVELPPGPLIVVAMDVHQRWVADMGMAGPEAGKGGMHLLLPPGDTRQPRPGYHVSRPGTNRVIVGVRSLPVGGDLERAMTLIRKVGVRPLEPPANWTEPTWIDMTERGQDTTPLRWETNLDFWRVLSDVVATEPASDPYRALYGELAVLGIVSDKPFTPDPRMRRILESAAIIGNAQMRVQAFADRRPDRTVWRDRKWEWAALRFEDGNFNTPTYVDLDAREKWFFQAVGVSPAMFRRTPGTGSLHWLGVRDETGAYLDGGKTYELKVPEPVPARLLWSVTVYDAETRSEIQTDQAKAALRSLFELREKSSAGAVVDLHFGPSAPAGKEESWIKTIPGKGWFAYFRIYGPEPSAFDGAWKPGDFEVVRG